MKTVLYIVENTESAQFRYRVLNVIEALEKSANWRGKWVLTSAFREEDLEGVSLAVILRQSGKDGKILGVIESAKRHGIKVLFDLDDLIFSYKDLAILMSATNSKNIFYWAGYVWGIRRIAKKVDGFVTTNGFLKRKLELGFSKKVAVIPNSLNKKQVGISDGLIKEKKKKDVFSIGYFSGSPTHTKDFQVVEPELIKFLEKHDDAFLRIVGYMDLSSEMKRLASNGRVKMASLVDYLKLEKLISEVDVNIAPLQINDFTNSKSELKFFEAGVVETVTIASPTYAFSRAITDSQNGFLAKSGEWYDKLEQIYKNVSDAEKIAKNAREYALSHFYGVNYLAQVEDALESLTTI
ncbi:MAG: glycosyltransferase [Candidatus Saccharibacteria bacterium]|nr:glycosyltransferase [Candidatus Saccharibacteria bacterium]